MDLVKKYVRCGLFAEARKLIESFSMDKLTDYDDNDVPLFSMLTLIREESEALGLSQLLLEKGFRLNASDSNGICALNYAIALKKIKLVQLFLTSFNFDLHLHRDRFNNTLLHYAFASASPEIIDAFKLIYSKYYKWNQEKFKKMVNCDGLAVADLKEYADLVIDFRKQGILNRSAASFQMSESFKLDSSPIVICKYINKVYNSNSTLKAEIVFVQNNKFDRNKNFKVNILSQIKKMNRIRLKSGETEFSRTKSLSSFRVKSAVPGLLITRQTTMHPIQSPNINCDYRRPKTAKGQRINLNMNQWTIPNSVKSSVNWRNDLKNIYREFSVIKTPSYRVSSAQKNAAWNHHGETNSATSLNTSEFSITNNSFKNSLTLGIVQEGILMSNHLNKKTGQYLNLGDVSKSKLTNTNLNSAKLSAYLTGNATRSGIKK